MPATLHVYTKNALLYTAQFGVNAGGNAQDRLFSVFCSTDSSVFDANFDRPLKQSTTSGGATTQTGLLDSGVVDVASSDFNNKWWELATLPGATFPTLQEFQAYNYNPTTAWQRGVSNTGSGYYNGPSCPIAARSALICMHTGASTADTLTKRQQSFALFMIDFGQLVTPPSGRYFTMQWLTFTTAVLQMSLA